MTSAFIKSGLGRLTKKDVSQYENTPVDFIFNNLPSTLTIHVVAHTEN